MPQVSVIVPVYNAEKLLGRCINSILSQTFRDLELILVDDGSSDGSLEICRNWAALDRRVRVVEQKNAGVSCARNRGLEEARGEYVQFVDSDDYIAPQMTEKLLDAMRFYGRELVCCSCLQFTERDGGEPDLLRLGLNKDESELVLDHDSMWSNMLLLVWETSSMEGPCTKLYVRKIITDNRLRFPTEVSLGEDFLFNMEYYRLCNGLVFLSEPMYFYRTVSEGDSLTHRARPDFLQTMCHVEKTLYRHVKRHHELTDEERQIFADHFSARLCAGFMNLSLRCGEETAKRQIAEIVQHSEVRDAFAAMSGAFPQYAVFPSLVKRCNVGGIIAECRRIADPPAPPPPPPAPGRMNLILTKLMRGLQRVPVGPVRKWARIMELNLMTVGLKTTIQRVRGKIRRGMV